MKSCSAPARPRAADVRLELDQVAGDETGGETRVAEDLDQQPAGVAAGAAPRGGRLLAGLDAGFHHADDIADLLLQAMVEGDEKVDGARLLAAAPKPATRRAGRPAEAVEYGASSFVSQGA